MTETTTTEQETEETIAEEVEGATTTPAQAKTKAKAAAAKIDVTLSDEQLDRVADRVVDKFAENGAFETENPPAPAEGEETADDAAATGEETIPPKRSWAQKFAGQD